MDLFAVCRRNILLNTLRLIADSIWSIARRLKPTPWSSVLSDALRLNAYNLRLVSTYPLCEVSFHKIGDALWLIALALSLIGNLSLLKDSEWLIFGTLWSIEDYLWLIADPEHI